MAKKTKEAGTAVVKWEEEFANMAAENAKKAKVSEGKFLSFAKGIMKYNGDAVEGNSLRCVIVGWAYHNAYYDQPFDGDNPVTPVCYATHTDEDQMVPHENSTEKQANACASCPLNEYESAAVGKGKACKNTIRLALIAENEAGDPASAEVVYASIPTMSMKNWLTYVKKNLGEKISRPHWSVVTEIGLIPDDKSQYRVTFSCEEKIEDSSLFAPLKVLWESTIKGIDFPYVQREAKPASKPAKKGKFARR